MEVDTENNIHIKFEGLFIDTEVIVGRVYSPCETGACKSTKDGYFPCLLCTSKNYHVGFALHTSLPIKLYVPPRIFQEIYPRFALKPLNTIELVALYIALIEYFDTLFDPTVKFMGDVWDIDAYDVREFAQACWGNKTSFLHQLDTIDQQDGDNTLQFIQVLEQRISLGHSIVNYTKNMVGKDPSKQLWVDQAKQMFASLGSIRMLEWTLHRCRDEKDKTETVLQSWVTKRASLKLSFQAEQYSAQLKNDVLSLSSANE